MRYVGLKLKSPIGPMNQSLLMQGSMLMKRFAFRRRMDIGRFNAGLS
jgi:hypothetical protein